jgi:hypothetical protein
MCRACGCLSTCLFAVDRLPHQALYRLERLSMFFVRPPADRQNKTRSTSVSMDAFHLFWAPQIAPDAPYRLELGDSQGWVEWGLEDYGPVDWSRFHRLAVKLMNKRKVVTGPARRV